MIRELYDGQVKIKFTEGNHQYRVIEPEDRKGRKDGVTTAINQLHKDGLTQWAANKAVEVFKQNSKELPDMSKEDFEKLCKEAKNSHTNIKDDAADTGKAVHEWIENYVKGEKSECDDLMQPSIDAFLEWEEEYNPQYLASERMVYSWEYDYCGQTDLILQIDGRVGNVDIKTGKPDWEYDPRNKKFTGRSRARSTHMIQNGGYDYAIREEDGHGADFYGVLYLPLDGKRYFFTNDHTDFWQEAFISVLQTSRLVRKANNLINPYQ